MFPSFAPMIVRYGITRAYPWRWFPATALIAILILYVFLIPLNYALVGYEMKSSYQRDFNTTTNYWWRNFMPYDDREGCEPRFFVVGDTFVTAHTIFTWTILGFHNDTPGTAGFAYNGFALDSCDVEQQVFTFDGLTAEQDIQIRCTTPDGLPILASTKVSGGARFSDNWTKANVGSWSGVGRKLSSAWQWYTFHAARDLVRRLNSLRVEGSPVAAVSGVAVPQFCPRDHLAEQGNCSFASTYLPPTFSLDAVTDPWVVNSTGGSVGSEGVSGFSTVPTLHERINDFLQVAHALVRVDLGNILPNNLFTNTTAVLAVNQTIRSRGPYLREGIQAGQEQYTTRNLLSRGSLVRPTRMNVAYLCHLAVPKSPGTAFVDITVAILSFGMTGWALIMFFSSLIAGWNDDKFDWCERHLVPDEGPRRQGTSNTLLDDPKLEYQA